VKVNLSLCLIKRQALKTYRGVKVQLHAFGKHICLAKTLWTCFRDVPGLNLSRKTSYPDWGILTLPESFQANTGIVLRLGPDRFLLNPSQFITHPTILRYIICHTQRVVKCLTRKFHVLFTSALGTGERSSPRPRCFTPGKELRYPLGGLQSQFRRCEVDIPFCTCRELKRLPG
jgi:hypothetical protein